jgi:hypothetical protein
MESGCPPFGGAPGLEDLDFSDLTETDADNVKAAIARGQNFQGYIPAEGLSFIIRNYRLLSKLGCLEAPWLDAYVHTSHFNEWGFSLIKDVFDACDRNRLLELKPLGLTVAPYASDRLTLFRGCAGPVHNMGMSWTPSLDKAIWYAAHHAEYYELANLAVYVTTVQITEMYCRLDHYDQDFIVCPRSAWRVAVPAGEFRLDRPR